MFSEIDCVHVNLAVKIFTDGTPSLQNISMTHVGHVSFPASGTSCGNCRSIDVGFVGSTYIQDKS